MRDFRVYAHRGASAELPENTLAAFARALERGANALETDAHVTRDGRVVLTHDPDGARIAGVARSISGCTLAEVRSWDAGHSFVDRDGGRPYVGRGFRVPTLEELLRELPHVPVNVDAKVFEAVPALIETVRRADAEARVLIASFDDRVIAEVRRLGYRGMTGLAQGEVARLLALPTLAHRLASRVAAPLRASAAQIPDRWRGIDLGSRRVIERCHALGLLVHYWTVNDPARALVLAERGADGVMTDDPRAIVPALSAYV